MRDASGLKGATMKHVTWGSAGRILVVDGDEDHGPMLATVLQAQGYRVDVTPSAQAGLDALRESRYQLLLVHYGLPDRNGMAFLEEARAEGVLHGAAQMLFTGKASLQSSETTTVLRKPIDLQDLVRQVHSMVGPPEGPGPPPAAGTERRRKTAEAQAARARHGAKLELALYVTLPWPSSLRAKANLSRVLARVPKGQVRLLECDLAREPQRAELDNVLFSPTLVKVWPAPKMWILGDLSEAEVLTDLLALCGIEVPAAPPAAR
jgi:circadian clock protein KaiB